MPRDVRVRCGFRAKQEAGKSEKATGALSAWPGVELIVDGILMGTTQAVTGIGTLPQLFELIACGIPVEGERGITVRYQGPAARTTEGKPIQLEAIYRVEVLRCARLAAL